MGGMQGTYMALGFLTFFGLILKIVILILLSWAFKKSHPTTVKKFTWYSKKYNCDHKGVGVVTTSFIFEKVSRALVKNEVELLIKWGWLSNKCYQYLKSWLKHKKLRRPIVKKLAAIAESKKLSLITKNLDFDFLKNVSPYHKKSLRSWS